MNQMPDRHNGSLSKVGRKNKGSLSRAGFRKRDNCRHLWYLSLVYILMAALFLSACSPLEPDQTQETADSDTANDTRMPDTTAANDETDPTDSENSESATGSEGSATSFDPELSSEDTTSENDIATSTEDTSAETGTATTEGSSSSTKTTSAAQGATTTRQTTASPAATTAKPKTTTRATPTPSPKPTSTPSPTPSPSPTPVPQSNFPYKNYGTFFRDQYGSNSQITENGNGGIFVDTGSTAQGVVLIRINNSAIPSSTRAKALFRDSGGKILYQYDILVRDRYVGLPLNMGNGQYNLLIAKHAGGTSYTSELTHSFNVSLASSLKPYTASSIAADFSRGSASVQKSGQLTSNLSSADGKVEAVYKWIVSNISYDRSLASRVDSGEIYAYWPDPDKTMSSRKGICFDYAALMCAMLRSQGIPTRMVIGPVVSGGSTIEHAWNEVFFEGRGWVIVAEFKWKQLDGSGWVHFDTTFAAGGLSPESIQGTTYTRSRIF